jgi:dUTP pyrophosphatase
MNTKIFLLPSLKETLAFNSINLEDYKPAYGGKSVGLDLYNTGPDIYLQNVARTPKVLIPTGLKICLPYGWGALVQERGSIIKTPLKLRAGVIDPEYTGEIFVNCVNLLHDENYVIKQHQKLPFQLIVVKCDTSFEQVDDETYHMLTNIAERGHGAIGSSDGGK